MLYIDYTTKLILNLNQIVEWIKSGVICFRKGIELAEYYNMKFVIN